LCALSGFAQQDLISDIQITGNRRIPTDTIRARIFSKAGDVYDQAAIERDFNALWNTGYFEDIRFEREESAKGWIIHIYVKEKPTIREINYVGLNSVSQSDVLDRFKERKVALSQESQYDPTKVKKAEVVIQELLAERGRQFATIRTEIRPIPPAAVALTFVVKEGPKIKVGSIRFEGNKKLSSLTLRRAMKNTHPLGIPHSIFLEGLFHRTFNASKLNEDAERVRRAYQNKGYFKVIVEDPQTKVRDTGHSGFRIPLLMAGKGKAVDITVPLEEGQQYRLKEIQFTGNKAITNTKVLRSAFNMKDGDVFNLDALAKGLDELRKMYNSQGYINFTSVPDPRPDDEHKTITWVIDLDEGKPFFVRRIEFVGNTTTRDKVIRRELALEEGALYNSELWKFSLLRLNQLQYFENLDAEKDTDTKIDQRDGTVDLTLKVKEKGKNSIGLTGGVSGLAGSFIGINYSTNNFLGLGETLSVTADFGNRQRELVFSFTEPYVFDRPLQLGFSVFNRRYDFNEAQQQQILSGQKLNLPQNFLDLLQNFSTSQTGFSVSGSYPLRRSLKRIGLGYSFDVSSTQVFSLASRQYFEQINFRNVSGPDALKGIVTSKVFPSFTINTINNPMRPHYGKSLFIGGDISGLGGNVAAVRPILEYKQFIPMRKFRPLSVKNERDGHQTLGFRLQGSFISGYKGLVANPSERFYLGGDTDLRGFDTRWVTPYAFLTERIDWPLTNPDGSAVPRDPNNARAGSVTIPLPIRQIFPAGGDTSMVANLEYRVPIAGPVAVAYFVDFGINGIARASQLRISDSQWNALTTTPFGCPTLDSTGACQGGIPFTGLTGPPFHKELQVVSGANWTPRMSSGLELQVIMPVINAPFRLYWAYNPLRMNTVAATPVSFTRDMFPAGGVGDFNYRQALATFGSPFRLREPLKTFRFTVSTTF
jgi:outer membrane protein insertion porin family